MIFRPTTLIFMLAVGVSVSACGGSDPVFDRDGEFRLRTAGPDEFAIIPTKPLEIPEDTVSLPEPSVGAKNRVDLEPQTDAILALGGQPDRLASTNIAADEQALVAVASRNGVVENIRDIVDEDSKKNTRKPNFFERWLGRDGRLQTYKSESIDPAAVTDRLRRQGIKTPSVRTVK